MTKSDTYIQYIVEQLMAGNVERGKVLAKIGKKWQIPPRTFDRYWKKAQELHFINQQAINELKEKEYTANELNAVKTQIKTKNERLLILQNSINEIQDKLAGNVFFAFKLGNTLKNGVVSGKCVAPIEVQLEMLSQIQKLQSEISKIEGDYAAVKNEHEVNAKVIKVQRE